MRVLWAPWRLEYLERDAPDEGCIFCKKPRAESADARRGALVLRVTEHASTIMNRYPYSNAHLMVAPRAHTADFAAMPPGIATAVSQEVQLAVDVLTRAYAPHGFNIGMNLGRSGGAGIADHLHWHVVPRWEGDTNFMPLLADTRVISQHLETAYDRLLPLFKEAAT